MSKIIKYQSDMSNGYFIIGEKGVIAVDTGGKSKCSTAVKFTARQLNTTFR